jgi:hypothetical protein
VTRIFLAFFLALSSFGAWALTPAQTATLRTSILADPALAPLCVSSGDGPFDIAAAYNLPASPAFIVWKTAVPNEQIGDAMNGTEIAGLSSLNMQRLQVLAAYSGGTQNPSRFDRRDAFDRVFSGAGGAITRPALLALWKRTTTRAERLFATGTGTDAVPGLLTFEGTLTVADVQAACTQ